MRFNPSVANVFFRAGEIEAWGRGIQRVFEACHEEDTPEPQIRVDSGDFWFEFPFSEAYLASVTSESSGMTTQKPSGKPSGKTSGKILEMIRQDAEVTIPEMAEAIGRSTRAIEMQLEKLKSQGTIRRVGPARGGRWEILEDSHE